MKKMLKKRGYVVIMELRTVKIFGHEKDVQYKTIMRKERWDHLHEELKAKRYRPEA